MSDPEGIDVERVTDWYLGNVGGAVAPLDFELVAGGRSNLTFVVTDGADTRTVLRRPPTSHVLPTAHDMGRESTIIAALAITPVPVPSVLGFCEDEAVNGRPFYVMGHVEGQVLRDQATAEKVLAVDARRSCGESIVDVLAAIHAVDPDDVGLGDLARREGYIERQLKRWHKQWDSSKQRELPIVDDVHAFLLANIPEQGPAAIVHGDYRLDNTIVGDDGSVRAVLDWELCTLGDPMADVGLLMVYWTEPGDELSPLLAAPTAIEGFPTRAELAARYAAASGRDLSQIDFYSAFGYWKLACILEGVSARYAGGAMGGDRQGFEGFAEMVERLAEAAKAAIERLG
ncbi:MAG TPA: phosphotransferase family protein [Acidimicrobiales bacterium]|nr:phosphotransferase family protein [Acidimicrobiales bacterium]